LQSFVALGWIKGDTHSYCIYKNLKAHIAIGIGELMFEGIQDIDKFVLCGVRMAQGRYRARCERGEVDAEVGQAKQVAQRTLLAPCIWDANGSG
jgi:hypothetical protein